MGEAAREPDALLRVHPPRRRPTREVRAEGALRRRARATLALGREPHLGERARGPAGAGRRGDPGHLLHRHRRGPLGRLRGEARGSERETPPEQVAGEPPPRPEPPVAAHPPPPRRPGPPGRAQPGLEPYRRLPDPRLGILRPAAGSWGAGSAGDTRAAKRSQCPAILEFH